MRDQIHHPFRSDFDARHAAARARIARARNVITLVIIMIIMTTIAAGGWLLMHPEQIGAFVGRIASGFSEVEGRP